MHKQTTLMQLDGVVDRKRVVPLFALSIQSHTRFADLSSVSSVLSDPYHPRWAKHDGDGHTAAVSSQCSSGIFEEWLLDGLGKAVVSCFFASSDVVYTLHWLDREVWMERKCSARQLEVTHRPVTRGVPRRSMKTVLKLFDVWLILQTPSVCRE